MKLMHSIKSKNLGLNHQDDKSLSLLWINIFAAVVSLLTIKVLWGFWDRDLTYGDTSYYFLNAILWHVDKSVNIVWSPLYTAYFGSWLNVSENANTVVFLHRIGLILISTTLVAWFALRTLPKTFALLLTCWWLALPIHYDTLYEVHLFAVIPLISLALVSTFANERWRLPILLGIALITTILIRNEFVLAVIVFLLLGFISLVKSWPQITCKVLIAIVIRYAIVLLAIGSIVALFYSASYIKGDDINEVSKPKHTLNMCQVYAFGYQQRNPEWKDSPWTECSGLMQEKFGLPMPSLRQMMTNNPREVLHHFWWNLSLTKAGLEVLLFNATSSDMNPDYAPVKIVPITPSILLFLSMMIIVAGLVLIFKKSSTEHSDIRDNFTNLTPVLFAVFIMSLAVIITQRPRPSYLLGAGILYMWLVLSCLVAISHKLKVLRSHSFFLVCSLILLWAIPSYKQIDLLSQHTKLGLIYTNLLPNKTILCSDNAKVAIENYQSEIIHYLCLPSPKRFKKENRENHVESISIASLNKNIFSTPEKFVDGLESSGANRALIDSFTISNHPDLKDCSSIRDAFLNKAWEQLSYSAQEDGTCIAAYSKDK